MQLSPRQIHLDFHTSEHIPGIGSAFDAKAFAKAFKEAHVSSVTVFARCHHGWLYYPSKIFPDRVHPNLSRPNLLLEEVSALHEAGIRAPVYITVQWDYHSAENHPEWLIRKADGSHEGDSFTRPGFYQSLCVNTGYYDFLEAQTREVCELLGDELDGIFFDIVGIRPCLCAACRREMEQKGIDMNDEKAVRAFAAFSMNRFKAKMSAVVREYSSKCTIFYNAGHVGPCTKQSADAYSHFELESLPSGGWGYLHFPATVRYARTLGKPCLGMTGKFHTSWGDFHSYKNQAALEFEVFRMLSMGCACSIGDQLEPDGHVNPTTYKLIGEVYRQFEEREAFALPSLPVAEAAVLTAENPLVENQLSDALLGACQMLDELALQYNVIDTEMDFSAYRLLIVPEDIPGTEELSEKLNAFVKNGGKILAAGHGGLMENGCYPACYGVETHGKRALSPDFLVADGPLADGLEAGAEYVMYMPGEELTSCGAKTLLSARAPYFAREGRLFCSHRYTPSAKGEAYPSVFENGGVIVFSHPIFGQYRANAPRWCKLLVKNVMTYLVGSLCVEHDGPSTMTVNLLHQPEQHRYTLHLLSYIPVRKSAEIDIIEERTKLADVQVRVQVPETLKKAVLQPEGRAIALENGSFTVPVIDGYQIIELDY